MVRRLRPRSSQKKDNIQYKYKGKELEMGNSKNNATQVVMLIMLLVVSIFADSASAAGRKKGMVLDNTAPAAAVGDVAIKKHHGRHGGGNKCMQDGGVCSSVGPSCCDEMECCLNYMLVGVCREAGTCNEK
ncbi:hypothetical protein Tsubulata_011575 [Turnera subulata]|uniref:Uncharacterized protein n=1 Tax=Turnera subulata TaxID=218843 RepID=A0A9Q0GJF6_9ROSI|nr:hypothetical protein Tsubulata_011575 [Turnera subulata]